MGLVYLIHFERPLAHAKHYIGWTGSRSPRNRLDMHRAGIGARLLQVLNELGIRYHVVRVWRNQGKAFERQLKNRKESPCLCPICNPKQAKKKYRYHTY